MAGATSRFRFVGANTEYLSDGAALEPGTFHDLGDIFSGDAHNQDLVDRGVLIEAPLNDPEPLAPEKASSKAKAMAGGNN